MHPTSILCLVRLRTSYNLSQFTQVQVELVPIKNLPRKGSHLAMAIKQINNISYLGNISHVCLVVESLQEPRDSQGTQDIS